MSREKLLVVALLILVFIGGVYLVKTRIGDIRPPSKDIGRVMEEETKPIHVGESVNFPLVLPQGFAIGIFVKNLGNARDLVFSPGGTLLVSIPADGRIVALPDRNTDGRADETKNVLTNLNKPHGISFHNGKLYVVEETRVVRYAWDEQALQATQEKALFSLPYGGRHFTRTIDFSSRGDMFISLGSSCDVCFEKNEWLAAVIVSDENGENPRLFAKGLRNSVFIAVNPQTDELWGTDMGRDFLGDDLPPDEVNIIKDGRDYGWPLCYGNKIHDTNFDKNIYVRSPCDDTQAPDYEIPAHSAPLGLTFINSPQFPKEWQGDLLVAYHGSWNRSTPIGYKIVRLAVEGNRVVGEEDFLSGFLQDSEAIGRPVDLAFDEDGSLYISDDKAGLIFKVIH